MGEKCCINNRGVARQSNIELLRILAVLGVVILHYNNPLSGGGMEYVQENSLNCYILYILESVFICAVDLFVLISGYFLSVSNKRDIWKPIQLIIQVMVFSLGIYLVSIVIGTSVFSVKGLIGSLIPANYFVIQYSAVYLISPFVNVIFDHVNEKQSKCFIVLSLLLFSIYPTLVDVFSQITKREWMGLSTISMYGSQLGYQIVNFVLMYIIGAYLRRCKHALKEWSTLDIGMAFMICIAATTIGARMEIVPFIERISWSYCNPVVIAMAILVFELFSRIQMNYNRIINDLAKGAFSVFLLHGYFINKIGIERAVAGKPLAMLVHIVLSTSAIYLLCWCVHYIYHKVTVPIFGHLKKRIILPQIDIKVQNR